MENLENNTNINGEYNRVEVFNKTIPKPSISDGCEGGSSKYLDSY